jgi:methionyl-tRNA formyltransferase
MKIIGAALLVKTIQQLARGTLKEKEQLPQADGTILKHAPKIFTETCLIDWNKHADEIHNLIRGLSPYPAAFTYLDNKLLKIFKSKKEIIAPSSKAGTYKTDHKTFLKFACSNGFIHACDVQLEGKKRMLIEDFLRGYRINN